MPKEPRVDHTYQTHTGEWDLPEYGSITATTVMSRADSPRSAIGSHISVIHPRTLGPNNPVVEVHNATKADPQMELFLHHGPIAENYAAHSLSGHTAPVVLGIAANLSKAQFNEVPSAPTDLSKHSLRVAQQLGDAVPNHSELPTAPTNNQNKGIDTDRNVNNMLLILEHEGVTPLPDEAVAAGTATAKQIVRRRREKAQAAKAQPTPSAPTPTAPKPDQLTIPGL